MSKALLFVGLVTLLGSLVYLNSTFTQASQVNDTPVEVLAAYTIWKAEFNRKYSSQEDLYRLGVFSENFYKIQEHNSNPERTYDLGQTQFMDITQEEFAATYLTLRLPEDYVVPEISYSDLLFDENDSVDWSGKITPVKDQGRCGSCWSFSATGAIEALFKVKKGQSVNLSEQQLVDCDKQNYGCNGGWQNKAISYAAKVGLQSESEYPYTGRDGSCKATSGSTKPSGVTKISASASSVRSAIAQYPVAVSVDATNWSLYSNGVFSNCKTSLNHAVLAVGYDASGNWIVKNSWSTSWGEKGHIRLAAGNTCGVISDVYHAV